MRVDFSVPEQDIRLVAIGMPVTVSTEVGNTELTGQHLRDRAEDRPQQPPRHRARRGRRSRRTSINPGQFLRVRVELPEEPNVIALPQTVLSSTLYGDSVFVVRTEGEGDAAEADGRAGLRQGRPPLARPRRDRRGAAARRRGGHRRPEPADRRRARRGRQHASTRRHRGRAAARTRARGRCISPSSSSAGRCSRRCSRPSSCSSASRASSTCRSAQYPEVEETVVTITTIYRRRPARPDPGLHHRADRRRGRDDREHRLRHLAVARPRPAWSACT